MHFHAISEKGVLGYQIQILTDLYSNVLWKQSYIVCPPSSYHSVFWRESNNILYKFQFIF